MSTVISPNSREADTERARRNGEPVSDPTGRVSQTLTQAPLRFEDCTQASTKSMPLRPSSTVG